MEDDKRPLLFSDGDLQDRNRGSNTPQAPGVVQVTRHIDSEGNFLWAGLHSSPAAASIRDYYGIYLMVKTCLKCSQWIKDELGFPWQQNKNGKHLRFWDSKQAGCVCRRLVGSPGCGSLPQRSAAAAAAGMAALPLLPPPL